MTPLFILLEVIPPFHNAVDNAISMLAADGFLGVTDFFVSGKYDLPMRQMSWARRFFWRCEPCVVQIYDDTFCGFLVASHLKSTYP